MSLVSKWFENLNDRQPFWTVYLLILLLSLGFAGTFTIFFVERNLAEKFAFWGSFAGGIFTIIAVALSIFTYLKLRKEYFKQKEHSIYHELVFDQLPYWSDKLGYLTHRVVCGVLVLDKTIQVSNFETTKYSIESTELREKITNTRKLIECYSRSPQKQKLIDELNFLIATLIHYELLFDFMLTKHRGEKPKYNVPELLINENDFIKVFFVKKLLIVRNGTLIKSGRYYRVFLNIFNEQVLNCRNSVENSKR